MKQNFALAVTAVVVLIGGAAASPAPAQAAPACSKTAAKRAVVTTSFAARIKRATGKSFYRGLPVMRIFGVYQARCFDLTGDGQREMLVQLLCCTVGSIDPWAIFTPHGNRWHLAFSRVKTNNFGTAIGMYDSDVPGGQRRPAVEEKIPVYSRDDPNCCPSSYHYRYTVWDGQRFVYGARW
jgi:hypothetical protein